MWAIVNERTGAAYVISNTEKGAKNYATRHNYFVVCQVSNYSMGCYNFKVKNGKRWVDISDWSPQHDLKTCVKTQ